MRTYVDATYSDITYSDILGQVNSGELQLLTGNFLSGPAFTRKVYLRILDRVIVRGKPTMRDIYVGEFPPENIARGVNEFRSIVSASREAAYLRLQKCVRAEEIVRNFRENNMEMKTEEELSEYLKNKYGLETTVFDKDYPLQIFEVDLIENLKDAANRLFGD